ncbi:MAG: hydantoinase/oxoprolinase family protein [Deltaproteobacteria bacterium]|nr:hydantoinase/oxoprolinase family protein [Deltaproteobacteria bacterium]
MFEIVIDTGGTFTDAVLIDQDRQISTAKYPTNPADPSQSIMGSIDVLASARNLTKEKLLSDTTTLVIGTTLSTNCVLEKKGAKCCLLHTRGFRDIPEIGSKPPREDIFHLKVEQPEPLIPRYLRYAVEERTQFNGEIFTPLNETDVLMAMEKAKAEGVEVPVICFLHSYINTSHEEKAADMVKADYPEVVVSSRIMRRWIEWDRLSTSMIAGYVKPVTSRFINTLNEQLKDADFKGTTLFITCSGGVAAPEVCLENPALLIGSGPAAGPLLGCFLADLAGFENVIVFDMGGTSCDVGMLPGRMIPTTLDMRIGEYRNGMESVDVSSIGTGGGSIAWIDKANVLHVGPSSAGADPGPACYGKGGRLPTVTDANVVLGYVPEDYFLGGTILLDRALSEKAIEEHIAGPLGIDLIGAAHAISTLAGDNMAQEAFMIAVQKGLDPREFGIVVGGGAGPVHATSVAERLAVRDVYIPKQSAVFCALGGALADYKFILTRFLLRRDDMVSAAEVKGLFDEMEEEGLNILGKQGVSEKDTKLIRGAELRYYGQLHDIEVLLPEAPRGDVVSDATVKALVAAFHKEHEGIYGWSDSAMPVTIAQLKLHAIGMRRPIELKKQTINPEDPSAAFKRNRSVYFNDAGGFTDTPCYEGDRLGHGNVIEGPAIVEETKTTVVVPKGHVLTIDAYENYILRKKEG